MGVEKLLFKPFGSENYDGGLAIITDDMKIAEIGQVLVDDQATLVCFTGKVSDYNWDDLYMGQILIWCKNTKAGHENAKQLFETFHDKADLWQINPKVLKTKSEKWSMASFAKDGLAPEKMLEWILANRTEYQRRDGAGASEVLLSTLVEKSVPLINKYFKQLGKIKNDFVFYNYESGQVIIAAPRLLNSKMFIYSLTDGDDTYWWQNYSTAGAEHLNFDTIAKKIMRQASGLGQFDMEKVRGKGCWLDSGSIVFNTGEYLYVDGNKLEIKDFESNFLYIKSPGVIKSMAREIVREDLQSFLKLCNMFSWENRVAGNLLAGWLMVAPICGALPWRPHIYITGMAGTGKSTIHENILARTLGDCTVNTLGDSTKSGLSQTLAVDALPVIFDEIENDNQQDSMRNEMVLRMARYSSSSQKGKTLKGTGDQSGAKSYVMRSCFCFSSITPSVKHYADYTRITLLSLNAHHGKTKEWAVDNYTSILKNITTLMGDDRDDTNFSEKFVTYANRNASSIIASYKTIRHIAQLRIDNFTARVADQIGMLLAGLWAYKSDQPITEEEAKILLESYDWEDLIPTRKQENQLQLVARLAQHKIRFRNEEKDDTREISRTVSDLLEAISGESNIMHRDHSYYTKERAENLLRDLGIKLYIVEDQKFVLISNTSLEMSRVLRDTQWANNWGHSLKAVKGAISTDAIYFNKAIGPCRGIAVPLSTFLNETTID